VAEDAQKLRITFVIPYFYPAWEYGGQPRSAYELARALVQRGHHVKVLTTDSGGRSRLKDIGNGRREVDGIEVVYYPNVSNWLAYRYRLFVPRCLLRELESEMHGSDIVHIHELRSSISPFAYAAARRLKIPYVLSGHGGLRRLGRAAAKALYDRLWGGKILQNAAAVIAVSPLEEGDAKTLGVEPRRIHRLPNIVRSEDYEKLPPPGRFRQRCSIPSDKIVLFLARLHPIKGADLLVKAFSRLKPETRTSLVIAGPNDGQEQELRRLVSQLKLESNVRFMGHLDMSSKKEALVDASLLVVPSRSEVFAITAVEALLCGTPVLLSSACGLYPLPRQADTVTFFRTEDVDDLAAKLAVVDEARCSEAPSASKNEIAQVFSANVIGLEAENMYRAVHAFCARQL
jgi:glycosyltransferase involved in cell wall biosynthesis